MNDKTQWTRFADHPEIPADAEVVALARSSKCQNGELCDKPRVAVFKRPSWGWSPVIGWELFWVVPKELHWLTRVEA